VHIIVTDDDDGLSRAAADLVARVVAATPDAAIVLATGATPMGLYAELAARYRDGLFDPSRLRPFQLDAYLGLGPDDDRSLYRWMKTAVLDPLDIAADRVARLPGDAPDPDAACRAYNEAVRAAGGFDLSVLGLGPNGHLGFNEPPVAPDAPTRAVSLTEESVESNARYWGCRERVPRRALTAGMDVLLAARATLLLVSGTHKREILHRIVDGPVSPAAPASYLQRAPDVTVIADRAAWGSDADAVSAG